MGLRFALVVFVLAVFGTVSAAAQDFGIMESAETIQRGNFKLVGYPLVVFGDEGADDEVGLVLRGGYGFTDRLDGEIAVAFYDGVNLFGANAELWLIRAVPGTSGLNLSARGGVHLARAEGEDGTGIDLAALLSSRVTPRVELLAALDYGQTFFDEPLDDPSTLHLVPGVEYRVSQRVDFLAEFGVGLDTAAADYLSAGFALYVR